MTVCIKKSKTDPARQSSTITIARSQSKVCAVAGKRDFLLQTLDFSPQSPMFQFKDGTPLSWRTLASILHTLLDLCGLQSNNYNTHSFRIGAATTAAAASLPLCLIKILGRWRSDSYERYIHLPQATLLLVPSTMAAYHQNHTKTNTLIFVNNDSFLLACLPVPRVATMHKECCLRLLTECCFPPSWVG